ncbi:MAG: hypothetical protein HC841_01525 [Verrucomicrobiae bacterium]|nr:hypothetical protein [Verrucomicrobiae bacterium]
MLTVRRPTGRLVGYAGLDPTDAQRWQLTEGLDPTRELFGIERIYRDPKVQQFALEYGVTLASDPLEVVRATQALSVPVISMMTTEFSRVQISGMLDPSHNKR